ncbi:hypothetical protein EDB92DRAFT_1245442 [Lactarius akahatsu]|uniref:Uncharacterized protein n=1 Tax=Lactarius akahatsu TaxID=416441 RepID=A0AAD4Q5S1_9AGAM|nr:hypothetical protein EDB92DRAFT_1245442 [Lactarius akahatsu]
MPALIPMHNTLGALFIGTVLSSILYGVTWLQVYSYYSGHCLKDRWPLKCFVAFLMLVDSANLVIIIYTTYQFGVTNFGDYLSDASKPPEWCQLATTLSAIILDVSVQHFYAYRIYHLGAGSPFLPAAISVVSLASLGESPPSSMLGRFHLNFPDFCKVLGSCAVQKSLSTYTTRSFTSRHICSSSDDLGCNHSLLFTPGAFHCFIILQGPLRRLHYFWNGLLPLE